MTESCYFCDEHERIEEHHIVPRRFGGDDSDENVVAVCPTCHSKLETLYNKRFYEKLGVERDTGPDASDGCYHPDCTADADTVIDDRQNAVELCDSHATCGHRGCSDAPSRVVVGCGVWNVYCETHAVCRKRGCENTETEFAPYTERDQIRLCQDHAERYWGDHDIDREVTLHS